MKKILFSGLMLLILSCDESSPVEPILVEDLCGVLGGDDFNEDGYHCGDLQVVQDIMDVNSITGVNPLDFTYLDYYSNEVSTQTWSDEGRLTNFYYSGAYSDIKPSIIPESIGNLSNLISLYLGNNNISTIPESIGNLSNLTSLNLRNNDLTAFPVGILSLSNLTYLDLYGNEITSIPENLCSSLTLLQEFDSGSNILCYEYHGYYNENYNCVSPTLWEQHEYFEDFCCPGFDNDGNSIDDFTYCCEEDEWYNYDEGTCQ